MDSHKKLFYSWTNRKTRRGFSFPAFTNIRSHQEAGTMKIQVWILKRSVSTSHDLLSPFLWPMTTAKIRPGNKWYALCMLVETYPLTKIPPFFLGPWQILKKKLKILLMLVDTQRFRHSLPCQLKRNIHHNKIFLFLTIFLWLGLRFLVKFRCYGRK